MREPNLTSIRKKDDSNWEKRVIKVEVNIWVELSRVQGNKRATHCETHDRLPYQVKWAWVVFKREQNTKHL